MTAYDRAKYLLLDPRIIASGEHIRLAIGKVEKEPHNPLLIEDKPWEVRFDNLYANVLFDEEEGIYKLWYNPFIVDEAASRTLPSERAAVPYKPGRREMGLCHATSHDGIVWEKPELGIVEFEGSTANNLVLRGISGSGIAAGVFKDAHDPDPSRRYKAFMANAAGTSPDGMRWMVYPTPEIRAVADTHNNAFWDRRTERYVGFTRLWDGGQRLVARTESADFRKWTKAVEVLRRLPDEPHRQTYAHVAFPYTNVYLALLMIFNTEEDTVDCELAWSADTVRWERICPGSPIIPRGSRGSFDWGCVYGAAYPIVRKDEILLYYGGSDGPHTGWRAGGLGLARLRPDGFAGVEPVDEQHPGIVVTNPVECTGNHLRISADAAGGTVRVGVMDDERCSLARCDVVTGDVTDHVVTWNGNDTLAEYRGMRLRLAFALQSARLYSFSFAE